jgi:DNA-binding beta-propeller fold protein YncE
MRAVSFAIILAYVWATPATAQLSYLYTFGSKQGIHPPKILNRRPATAAMGTGDHPYGIGFPVAVASDRRGRIWITDSGTLSVHVFDMASGGYKEIRKLGSYVLQQPGGIVADAQGRIYIVDTGSGAVYVFDEQGEYDRAMVKPGSAVLERPTAIAISEDGRTVYVADPPRNAVVELNREGEVNGVIALPPELRAPVAISVVRNQIYVLGDVHHKVGIFNPKGQPRGEIAWEGIAAPPAFTWDAKDSRFLVANPRWAVIQSFDEQGHDDGAFGQFGDHVDQVQRIDGLFADAQGRIYEVDSHNGKVLVFANATPKCDGPAASCNH